MKSLSCLSICCTTLMFCAIAESFGQQPVPGAGPPNPQIAQPLEQQALQGGLSGSAAAPHPQAGAQNPQLSRNALSGINANAQASPGAPGRNAAPVQPLYEGSAAIEPQSGAVVAPPERPLTGAPLAGAAQQRGRLGVWLIESGGPGVRVGRITSGSAADRAGLRSGDVILQLNGRGLLSPDAAARLIRAIPVGETATLTVWRDGEQQQTQITMEPTGDSHQVGYRSEGGSGNGDLGARIAKLEQQLTNVTEELQRLQREMSQMRGAGSPSSEPASGLNSGTAPAAIPPPPATTGTAAPPAAADQNPGSPPSSSGTAPANEGAGAADDLFGSGTPSSDQPK